MTPSFITLQGFRGMRDGLGRAELAREREPTAHRAQLGAHAGPTGSGEPP